MSQLHLSDEILMAFADGELDEAVAAAVAKAMAEDPGVARRVVDFQQSRKLSRSAFSSMLMPDVPAELHAAVSAQVEAYEAGMEQRPKRDINGSSKRWAVARSPFMPMALAASVAAVAVALGFFAGRQGSLEGASAISRLDDPLVLQELGRAASGSEVELPYGRMRVISTYRLANGPVCREFRLSVSAGAAEAVACRNDGWNVTFALARAADAASYAPSGGGDPVAAYLEDIGAGEPLVDEAEARALAGAP